MEGANVGEIHLTFVKSACRAANANPYGFKVGPFGKLFEWERFSSSPAHYIGGSVWEFILTNLCLGGRPA